MRRYVTSGSIALLLAAQTVHAQESAKATAADGGTLQEVVVTAQRRNQPIERTPVSVSAVSGQTLQNSEVTTEAGLQSLVPGLTVKAGQNSDSLNFAIRGESVDAYSGTLPGVMPYFDQIQFDSGDSTPLYDLQSVQVLKGPQGTLFGRNATGGAVLYTSASPKPGFGGYVTADYGNYGNQRIVGALNVPVIGDVLLARVAMLYSDGNGYQYDTVHHIELGGMRRYAGRLSLTFSPGGGFKDDFVADYAHANGYSMSDVLYDIYPVGSTKAPAPANFVFTPAGFNASIGLPNAWDAYVAAHPGVDPLGIVHFAGVQAARGPYTVSVSSLPFHQADNLIISNVTTQDLSDDARLKNIFGYTNLRSFDGAEYDGSPFVVDERGTLGGRRQTIQYSDELQLLGKTFNKKLSYVTGIYADSEKTDERNNSFVFDLSPFAPAPDQINHGITHRKSWAVYMQGTYDLSSLTRVHGLSGTLGARYTAEQVEFLHAADDFFETNPNPHYATPQSDTFRKPSWHVGLQWQMLDSTLLYLTSSSSVRDGGFNFYSPPIAGFGDHGGSEYGVESATDIELGLKFKGSVGGMAARTDIALYHQWVNDSQRVTYTVLYGALAAVTVNVPKTEVDGVEFDGAVSLAPWLVLGGSFAYTDARFTENMVSVLGGAPVAFGPVPDTPRSSGSLYAKISHNLPGETRLTLRLEGYGQSPSTFSSTGNTVNPGTTLPGYGLFNARLTYSSLRSGWSVAAYGKNLTNKVYYTGGLGFGSLFTYNLAVPGLPRTYGVELSYDF